jgi:hypothetical protein
MDPLSGADESDADAVDAEGTEGGKRKRLPRSQRDKRKISNLAENDRLVAEIEAFKRPTRSQRRKRQLAGLIEALKIERTKRQELSAELERESASDSGLYWRMHGRDGQRFSHRPPGQCFEESDPHDIPYSLIAYG